MLVQALAERELVRHQIGFASRTEGTNIQGGEAKCMASNMTASLTLIKYTVCDC